MIRELLAAKAALGNAISKLSKLELLILLGMAMAALKLVDVAIEELREMGWKDEGE